MWWNGPGCENTEQSFRIEVTSWKSLNCLMCEEPGLSVRDGPESTDNVLCLAWRVITSHLSFTSSYLGVRNRWEYQIIQFNLE